MTRLYDVNLLFALFSPDHQHHETAVEWRRRVGEHQWATCEITWSGFVRLSCNPNFPPLAVNAVSAMRLLAHNTRSSQHTFLRFESAALELLAEILRKCQGYRQVTDAFLIHIAVTNQATLSTTDRRPKHLSPDPDAVEVVPLL